MIIDQDMHLLIFLVPALAVDQNCVSKDHERVPMIQHKGSSIGLFERRIFETTLDFINTTIIILAS